MARGVQAMGFPGRVLQVWGGTAPPYTFLAPLPLNLASTQLKLPRQFRFYLLTFF